MIPLLLLPIPALLYALFLGATTWWSDQAWIGSLLLVLTVVSMAVTPLLVGLLSRPGWRRAAAWPVGALAPALPAGHVAWSVADAFNPAGTPPERAIEAGLELGLPCAAIGLAITALGVGIRMLFDRRRRR